MYKLLALVTFLTVLSCRTSSPKQPIVTDQKIIDTKQLITQIINENSQTGVTTYVIDSVTTFPDNKKLFIDTILNKKQIDEFHRKIRKWQRGVWTKEAIDHTQIISEKRADSLVKRGTNICYLQFSRPLFTGDGQYCVLDVEYHHPYTAFFYDAYSLYHKENGKWKKVFTYSEAIS